MVAVPQTALEHRAYGVTLFQRGLLVAAGEAFQAWLELIEASEEANLILAPLSALAACAQARQDAEGAMVWLNLAIPYLDRPEVDPSRLAGIRTYRIWALTELGRYEDALKEAALTLDGARRAGSVRLTGLGYLNLGRLHGRRQEWLQARRMAGQALEHFTTAGDQDHMARALGNRGIAHMEMGAYRLAERDFTRAMQLFESLGGSVLSAYLSTEMGRLAYMKGDVDRALLMGTRALDVLFGDVQTLDKDEVARVSELFGIVFAEQGNRNLALKYLNRAAAYYSQLSRLGEWQRVTDRIARALLERGRATGFTGQDVAHRLEFLTAVLDLTDDIESVDPYLRGHSEGVARMAGILGRQLGLGGDELRILTYAGRLHDVGKVAVDASILTKAGPLTEGEWKRVQIHPVVGEEMVRPYGFDREGLAAIRHHHERWGGGGYPDGLAGDAIPRLARMLSVADVYDAVTSDRAYRKAMTHSQAMDLLRRMAGKELDPELVSCFCRLHEV